MRAGSKNNVVSIIYFTETRDPRYGTSVNTPVIWKDNIFCKVTHKRGKEVEVAGQITAESYVKFEFDFYDVDGITEEMIIRLGSDDYNIRAILRDEGVKEWIVVDGTHRPPPTGRT